MKRITKSQYLRLLGLITLARQHNQALTDIEKAFTQILPKGTDEGHISDMVWASRDLDDGLRILKIGVKDEPAGEKES